MKNDPKYKEYERSLAEASAAGLDESETGGSKKNEKKYKSYEVSFASASDGIAAPVAGDNNNDLEQGAKQRKVNKRYKDYETAEESKDKSNKKDK